MGALTCTNFECQVTGQSGTSGHSCWPEIVTLQSTNLVSLTSFFSVVQHNYLKIFDIKRRRKKKHKKQRVLFPGRMVRSYERRIVPTDL